MGGTRVLQMCESFGGGNMSSVTQICNGLAARGYEVHLAFSRRAETPTDIAPLLHPSVGLHELQMTREIHPPRDAAALLASLALMHRLDPDVIHLHSSKAGFIGRAAAFVLRRSGTLFYSPRGLSFLQRDVSQSRRRSYLLLERAAARLGGTVVACSQGELEQVRLNMPKCRAILIENAVDVSIIPARRARQDDRVRIGTVGRITAKCNPKLFAALARRLRREGVDFVWIGGGEEADHALLERDGVRVTGWLTRALALEELSALDIYAQTSLWEGMPISVIEAQVAGIPAVVTDILGNRDVVAHGQTGLVGATEEQLAEHLDRLIREPDTRAKLGERSRALALRRFDLGRLLDELTAAYRAALAHANK